VKWGRIQKKARAWKPGLQCPVEHSKTKYSAKNFHGNSQLRVRNSELPARGSCGAKAPCCRTPLRLPKLPTCFHGSPCTYRNVFSGVLKTINRFSRESKEPLSLKRASRKTGQIWRSKYLKVGLLGEWMREWMDLLLDLCVAPRFI